MLWRKLVYDMSNSFKRTISAEDVVAKYRG